jgi:histidyl-tRNA synthetase
MRVGSWVGFGFGDCVIMELLRQKNQVPTLVPQIDFVIMAFNAEMRAGQVLCANKLRQAGYAVDVLLEPAKKVAKAFNYADRVNGRRSIFVAPDKIDAAKATDFSRKSAGA